MMADAYLVVRIKGQADVPHWARTTMSLMKLEKKYRATIVPATDSVQGMLHKIQTFVSWTAADPSIVRELVEKKGRKAGYARLTDQDIQDMGYENVAALADELASGRKALSHMNPLKPWFALAPPRKGFKRSTKKLAGQKGVLGRYNDLPELVRRMI